MIGLGLNILRPRYGTAITLSSYVDPIVALNPLFWLRTDSVPADVDDPVSEWLDVSGNENHFTQASGTKQPFMTADGPEFDGLDDFMSCAALTINDFTLCAVVSLVDNGSFPVVVAIDADTQLRFFLDTRRPQFLYKAGEGITAEDPIPLGAKTLLTIRRSVSSGDAELLVNNISVGTASGIPAPTTSPTYIGSSDGSSSFLAGIKSEVVLFPEWLADVDLTSVSQSIITRNSVPI